MIDPTSLLTDSASLVTIVGAAWVVLTTKENLESILTTVIAVAFILAVGPEGAIMMVILRMLPP